MADQRAHPRLFLGNFDFEHQIADPKWKPNETLKRLNAELAAAWLSIAEDGDLIWTPLPFDQDFFTRVRRERLPNVVPIQSPAEAPQEVECIPWGWSPEIRRLSIQYGWKTNAPGDQAVRRANSRKTSADLEQQWNVGINGARSIVSVEDLNTAIQSLDQTIERWVVKAEFGMSARERILGSGAAKEAQINWVRRRLKQSGIVFFEPWVDRISEAGIQIEVPVTGLPKLLGLTPMYVDGRGQYAGSWFAYHEERFPVEGTLWAEAIEVALRAAKHVQSLGYFGPLGIDAMIYRNANRTLEIRPLQDINARWTMGCLSLGWRKLIEPGEEGFWKHGSDETWKQNCPTLPERLIKTSPETVGTTRCAHETCIMFWK